ncbi:phosphatase PAP2 family protein [Vicingaceae bacterium]|nr:phosphatase PAP2 family protein [Vicingaceae bacterium]
MNHFLQQFDYKWLKLFLEFISALGTLPFVVIFIFGITFILNFRKGVVLVNIAVWTILLTVVAKHAADFPRPIDTDTTLMSNDYNKVNHQLKSLLPSNFTGVLDSEILSVIRNDDQLNYGFPSCHASLQTALWLGMFFLFRKKWILTVGISLILLTIFSRLYLAHHFLADVLGGLTLGMIVLGLLGIVIIRSNFFKQLSPDFKSLNILWMPLLAIPFINHLPVWVLGILLSLNLTATFVILHGSTLIFSKNTVKRILTGCIIITLLFATYYLIGDLKTIQNIYLRLLTIATIGFLLFRGSILLLKRVKFLQYKD